MKMIEPSSLEGALTAPPSKSMMQRAVAAAALAHGSSVLLNPSFCEDAIAALGIAEGLGAEVRRESTKVRIKGGGQPRGHRLACGESGLCMRLFTPMAALFNHPFTLTGTGSLVSRPVGALEEPLRALGALCQTHRGFPPVAVRGPIRGGRVSVDGSMSSQVASGLLMALPLCPQDSVLTVADLKSKPYLRMTLSLLGKFGIIIQHDEGLTRFEIPGNQAYHPRTYRVEGDWSGGAFLLVAGAIAGRVKVRGLSDKSLQADRAILEALEKAGAKIQIERDAVTVEQGSLKAFKFDATDCPDLFPPLAALACHCQGRSVIQGTERLRHKESDRALALVAEFGKMGARIHLQDGRMEVTGKRLRGGEVSSRHDHRIAMACAVAGLGSEKGVAIRDWACVAKSYPQFFDDLETLRRKGR
jgi:3-phosphoshikimate 1-carboxyvinyltransferase